MAVGEGLKEVWWFRAGRFAGPIATCRAPISCALRFHCGGFAEHRSVKPWILSSPPWHGSRPCLRASVWAHLGCVRAQLSSVRAFRQLHRVLCQRSAFCQLYIPIKAGRFCLGARIQALPLNCSTQLSNTVARHLREPRAAECEPSSINCACSLAFVFLNSFVGIVCLLT